MKKNFILILLLITCITSYGNVFHGIKASHEFSSAVIDDGGTISTIKFIMNQFNLMLEHEEKEQYRTALQIGVGINATFEELHYNSLNTEIYALFLDHFASNFNQIGAYQYAIYYGLEAEKRWRSRSKKESDRHIGAICTLANYYYGARDVGKAEEWIDKGIELTKGKSKYSEFYHQLLNTRACILDFNGRSAEAMRIEEDFIKTVKKNNLSWTTNLISFQYRSGFVDKAISGIQQLINELKQQGNDKTFTYASLLNRYANYIDSQNHVKAITLEKEAISILKGNAMTLNSLYAECLSNLAVFYYNNKEYDNAVLNAEHAINIWNRISMENYPSRLNTYRDLVLYQFKANKWPSAVHNMIISTSIYDKNIMYSMLQPITTRRSIWNSCKVWYMNTIPEFAYHIKNDSLDALTYDAALLSKGILLNTDQSLRLIAGQASIETQKLYDEWQNALNKLNSPHPIEMYQLLAEEAETKEKLFLRDCREINDIYHRMEIKWQDVQNALSNEDVAIEFIDFKTEDKTTIYAALVLDKSFQFPKFVPIISSQNNHTLSSMSWKELSSLIWGNLEKYIVQKKNIYFSASGEIYTLPIESFPDWRDPQKRISDSKNIYRLSSTRELVLNKSHSSPHKAVIYGGLDYNISIDDMVSDNHKYELQISDDNSDEMIQTIDIKRAAIKSLKYLPGTLKEAKNITSSIISKVDTISYLGAQGTEASLKSLSGKDIHILHIGTHGFYDSSIEENESQTFINDNNLLLNNEDRVLSYSGLFFAGANNKYTGDSIPEGIEDGILTAQEISLLNLKNIDMVTLSVCHTAQGEITGDGVFGLQRGFKKAGVNSILMSLWNVDDKATCTLMTEFYRNWIGLGKSKHDALELAKEAVRKHPDWKDPEYWAPFILLDGLD